MCSSKIIIDKGLLAQLLRDLYKLSCLETSGVDNWEYYSKALNSRIDYPLNYYDFIDKSDDDILKYCDFIK